ncbi:hypothetical protein ACHQM5_020435 [Ranunculus cassubicifolius]
MENAKKTKFYGKAIGVRFGGTWRSRLVNGVKQFEYSGGTLKDTQHYKHRYFTYSKLMDLVHNVVPTLKRPKVTWLVRGIKMSLDSDSRITLWWLNTIPSKDGFVSVYVEEDESANSELPSEQVGDVGPSKQQGVKHVGTSTQKVVSPLESCHDKMNDAYLEEYSELEFIENFHKRPEKLPIKSKRRKFTSETLPEEELDPIPTLFSEDAFEPSGVDTEETVSDNIEDVGVDAVDDAEYEDNDDTFMPYNLRKRVVNINNIEPDEEYYSDSSDGAFDPADESEFIEDEDVDDVLGAVCVEEGVSVGQTYTSNTRLQQLASDIPTCEPYEGRRFERVSDAEYRLYDGQTWPCVEKARHYLRTFGIRNKFVIKWIHSDLIRIRCKCKEAECGWFCRIRKLPGQHTFKLKLANFVHDCTPNLSGTNPMANAQWIAEEIEEDVRVHQRSFRPKEIIKVMTSRHFVRPKYWQAWHARAIALDKVHGSYEDSYKKIPQLCIHLLEANPGSIIKFSRDHVSRKWTGTCISFKACLDGFVQGCRPLVGLDGCHLKGKFGGVCLAMTSLDGNNGMFPLGIYLCQVENKENWKIFMEFMKDELNKHPMRLMIMSDRQKGLDAAVDEVFPNATKRYCFRHIFQNMKDYHRGELIEKKTWKAARAYTENNFKKWMGELDTLSTKKKKPITNEGANGSNATNGVNVQRKKRANEKTPVEYLMSEDTSLWARYELDVDAKVEHITNNFSESFNSWILEIRDKPLHKLIIQYTLMMMTLMFNKRQDANKLGGDDAILPRVKTVIDGHIEWYRHYIVTGSDTHHFSVHNSNGTWWNVDLEKHTCDCRKWDISGIPCVHAVASIVQFSSTRVIDWSRFCSPLLKVKKYKAAYASGIKPPLHEDNWESVPSDVLPPMLHRRPGRPRTKRRRGEHEGPAPTNDNERQCSTCGIFGHYKSTCQVGQTKAQVNATVRGRGNATSSRGRGGAGVGATMGRGRGSVGAEATRGSVGAGVTVTASSRGRGGAGVGATMGRGRGSVGAEATRGRGSVGAGVVVTAS